MSDSVSLPPHANDPQSIPAQSTAAGHTHKLDLSEVRARIDALDLKLLNLFEERLDCTREVAAYKRAHNLPILDRGREREKLERVARSSRQEYLDYNQVLFTLMMDLAKGNEARSFETESPLTQRIAEARTTTSELFPMAATVACQGVEGAYSQVAADRLFRRPAISYYPSFEAVFDAVESGTCAYGVIPVENSTAGSVNQVYDLMSSHDFYIVRTLRLKVDHSLLALDGATLEGITDVYSHPQAISQCQEFLAAHPTMRIHMVENTAVAAQMVANSNNTNCAALSSRSCAELYNLKQLARSVQDRGNNYTRFAVISKTLQIYPGADRTSLMMITNHEPGSLYKVLGRFFSLDINLCKLESRPIPERDFEFMFYFDLECPVAAPQFAELTNSLADICEEYRYLGSYAEMV